MPHLVRWSWPNVLVVQVQSPPPEATDGVNERELVFVSPTLQGLAALENCGLCISNMWLLRGAQYDSEALRGFTIEEISSLPAKNPNEQPLTILHAEDNRMLCVDEKGIFDIQALSTDWDGSGPYKRLIGPES
ncbi:hypothetical protein JZU69_00565 [bacterium]|nr:hypothetical protein [bacterium]